MIKNLIAQINHLGYKINQDPLNMSSWKIAVPNDSLSLYTLDYEKNKIFLYKDDICLCEISAGEDPFLILRHLPTNSFLNSKPIKTPIESLYILCDIHTQKQKNQVLQILNSKSINQFKTRRDFAYYILNCMLDSGFFSKNKNVDLSLIDIILNIV
tara:strand:+ start:4772 stop:5239 length:468 start_codon:yes stop_codon:yes gene_type:complete